MNGPFQRGDPMESGMILFAIPRWIVVATLGAVLLNAFATALLATALVLHLSQALHR